MAKKLIAKKLGFLDYSKVGEFFRLLRLKEGTPARALEFVILTACRSGDVTGARWTEFDLDGGIWVIPPSRMKARRKHCVPLVPEMMEVLKRVRGLDPVWVFPDTKTAGPLTSRAVLKVLKQIQPADIRVLSFRSTFSMWAVEKTDFCRELVVRALAHPVDTAVAKIFVPEMELERRRVLMREWGEWCSADHDHFVRV